MQGKSLLIVYQSSTGATEQIAGAIAHGACGETGLTVKLQRASTTSATDVLAADGYLFASPEYLAAMGGLMKDFFDRCYYDVLDQVAGRPYSLAVCAGSDGHGAIRQIERIATGWRLRPIAPPLLIVTHAQTSTEILAPKSVATADLQRATELGAAFAAGLSSGIF
jgi:multimeric flavodoxin WrbA